VKHAVSNVSASVRACVLILDCMCYILIPDRLAGYCRAGARMPAGFGKGKKKAHQGKWAARV
jgi:hypothetical protein